jgi:uncharacterized protein (TIGR03086 family)
MSDHADRYRRLAADFTAEVAAVPADDPRWSNPSPCSDWDARAVVSHMQDTHRMFFGLIGRELPAGPTADDDPAAAWAHVRDELQAALDDPDVAGTEFDGMFGRTRWEDAVDRFITGDVLAHRWDLGRALGGDPSLDADEITRTMKGFEGLPDEAMRGGGVFGPAIEPPPDATEQERFLAFIGRSPR